MCKIRNWFRKKRRKEPEYIPDCEQSTRAYDEVSILANRIRLLERSHTEEIARLQEGQRNLRDKVDKIDSFITFDD